MAQSTGRHAPACYQLRVDGHLDDHWSAWFGDLTLTHESGGTTSLSGRVSDQAELHGLLTKVRDLGVTLISVAVIDPSDGVAHVPDSVDDQKAFTEHRTHEAGETRSPADTQGDLEGSAGEGDGAADAGSEDLNGGPAKGTSGRHAVGGRGRPLP